MNYDIQCTKYLSIFFIMEDTVEYGHFINQDISFNIDNVLNDVTERNSKKLEIILLKY